MWGNTLGWSISALLVLVTAAMLWLIETGGRASRADTFGRDPRNISRLELPPPTLVVPEMTGDEDSGELYLEAIRRADANQTDALQPLLQARTSARASIFLSTPRQIINYDNVHPPIAALERLATNAVRAAAHSGTSPEQSRLLLESVFSLGHKLFSERLTYEELDLGMRLMAESTVALRRWTEKNQVDPAARIAQIDQFNDARLELTKTRILPVATRIRSLDGRVVAANAGNVMHWVQSPSIDRVWRVESILAVGRLRFFVGESGRGGNRIKADEVLHELSSEDDVVVRAAVDAAKALTPEQFRLLR
jgi:hypothetical protein